MFIYKSTCLVNGKIYIGQSVRNEDIAYFGSGCAIHLAVIKYKKKNFTREILRRCKTIKELNFFEKFYIKKFNSMDRKVGYNLCPGGGLDEMTRWLANDEEYRLMRSVSSKRFRARPEVKAAYSERMRGEGNPMFGKKRSPEVIARTIETFKESYKNNPQVRLNLKEGAYKIWDNMRAVPGKVEEMITRRARSKQRPVEMYYKTSSGRDIYLRTFTGAVEVQREKGFCKMNIGTCARRNRECGLLKYIRYGYYWKYPVES